MVTHSQLPQDANIDESDMTNAQVSLHFWCHGEGGGGLGGGWPAELRAGAEPPTETAQEQPHLQECKD